MDADLQDPPELIPEFVKHWRHGYQNVYGVRVDRRHDTFLKRSTASLFYRIFNILSDTPMPPHAGDFRLLGPDAVKALRACRERSRFMKGLYSWVGFPGVAIPYERPPRKGGHTSFNSRRLWNLAMDGFISHSTILLRVWTYIGAIVILLTAGLGAWLLGEYFLFRRNPPGFYLTVILILGFSSFNFIMLGIIGEYIGRIYDEVKGRPLYFKRSDDLDLWNIPSPVVESVQQSNHASYSTLKEFMRFLVVGAANTTLNFLLYSLCIFVGLNPPLSAVVAFVGLIPIHLKAHASFVFRSQLDISTVLKSSLSLAISMGLNVGLVTVFWAYLLADPIPAQVLSIGPAVAANYMLLKFFVFSRFPVLHAVRSVPRLPLLTAGVAVLAVYVSVAAILLYTNPFLFSRRLAALQPLFLRTRSVDSDFWPRERTSDDFTQSHIPCELHLFRRTHE